MDTAAYRKLTGQHVTALVGTGYGRYEERDLHVIEYLTDAMIEQGRAPRYEAGHDTDGYPAAQIGGSYATPAEVLAIIATADAKTRAEQAGDIAPLTRVIYDDDARPTRLRGY